MAVEVTKRVFIGDSVRWTDVAEFFRRISTTALGLHLADARRLWRA